MTDHIAKLPHKLNSRNVHNLVVGPHKTPAFSQFNQFGRMKSNNDNMSMNANLTEIAGNELYVEYFCSESFTKGIRHHLIFLSTFVVFLCIFTSLGNVLILVALRKECTLGSPSKLLLRSLATSDLCVGVLSNPLGAIYWLSAIKERWSVCYFALSTGFFINYALCGVSLLTTSAISVDRLLALSLGMRYRETVTLKRVYGIIFTFWILVMVCSAFSVKSSEFGTRFLQTVFSICLATSTFSHIRIFFNLRKHRTRVQNRRSRQDPPSSSLPIEVSIAKHKKAVSSVIWIQLALLICYLPYPTMMALSSTISELSQTLVLCRQYGVVFAFVNSLLNPLLYCWKISEVRRAVVTALKKFRSSSSD
ncbi:sphingosine 1-phosphate receptor 2-like [Montipora capricornis]|uniref:sphingosine 1-phosphate receptor 2-like n=1 Tax=Montipora capricornis TaxID=246305 RepID=UPI0035F185C9